MNTYKRKSPKTKEPMSSGRAAGNPNANTFLPSFLLGGLNTENMTFKGNRRGSKTSFSGYQDEKENQSPGSVLSSKGCQTNDGPPVISIFDTMWKEKYLELTPLHPPTPTTKGQLDYNLRGNSYQRLSRQQNTLRIKSRSEPLFSDTQNIKYRPPPASAEFWVTVYGFEQTLFRRILEHFAKCGNIKNHALAPDNGNWVHIKYTTQMACDKALSYTEQILFNTVMIGVKRCQDQSIIDKEKHEEEEGNIVLFLGETERRTY